MEFASTLPKVVKSAIIVMPPEAEWTQIQAIRKVYDKAYDRWMPHVNMVYPFVSGENFPDVVEQVRKALSGITPFKITLNRMGYFPQKSACTMWVDPTSENPRQVHQINSELEKAFPQCDDLSSKGSHGFSPHLTLGQFPKSEIDRRMKDFMTTWTPIEFTCSEVYLICRNHFDDPFKIIYRVPFGGGVVEEVNKPPNKSASSSAVGSSLSTGPKSGSGEKSKLFIANLDFKVEEAALSQMFKDASLNVVSITIARKPDGRTKGFAFMELGSAMEAQTAIDLLNGKDLLGRPLSVQYSK